MGLYVSRETLRKEQLDLILEKPGESIHPTFVIVTVTAKSSGKGDK